MGSVVEPEDGSSLDKHKMREISKSTAKSPALSPESLLGDISFLNQFKDKMVKNETKTVTNTEICGRYSLLDRNLNTVDTTSHIITELWKLAGDKSDNCLLGKMESCETEIVIGVETAANSQMFSHHPEIARHVVKADYRDFLVPTENANTLNSQSDGDTDDLIEDAKNYIRTAQVKLVDNEDWKDIDNKRRKRRLSKKERDKRKESSKFGSDGEENEVDLNDIKTSEPYLPRRISDLEVGNPVRVISAAGARISPGVVRFIGYVDGIEKVGVELKDGLGDCDGGYNGRFYFKCSPGYGQFVEISRVVMAWKT